MRPKMLAVAALMTLALASPSLAGGNHHGKAWGYRNNGRTATLPAGTTINVRLDTKLSTDDIQPGDRWTGTVTQSVGTGDRIMIPAGSPVEGVVASVAQGTHSTPAQLDLAVREVTVDGQTRLLNADTPPIVGGTSRAKKLGAVAGGAAAGALLGHTVAKGKHGTLIGGLVGGAAGYGLSRHAFRTLQLKPGTVVTFTTREGMVARR